MSNPLLFESGTAYAVLLHQSQENNLVSYEMLCLYLGNVNRFEYICQCRTIGKEVGLFASPHSSIHSGMSRTDPVPFFCSIVECLAYLVSLHW